MAHGLMLASHHGAYDIAKYLIDQGTDVNAQNMVSACIGFILLS